MAQERDGSRTLLLIIWALYLLSIFALVDFAIALTLFAHRDADATMFTSLVLIFTSAVLSIIYVWLHIHLAHRFRRGCQAGQKRTHTESISRFLPRLLVVFWIAASANGLVVAARQPKCMSATVSDDLWRAGLSCALHRSATAMAVGALIATCVLFCSIEVSDRPFYASPLGIYRPQRDSSGHTAYLSEFSCSSSPSSSSSSCQKEKLVHSRSPIRHLSDRAFWLQRQNSLSSRTAIYPPCLRQSPGLPRSAPRSLRSASTPPDNQHRHWPSSPSRPSLRPTPTSNSAAASLRHQSVSECRTLNSSTKSFPTRPPSSVSSSTSTSTSSPLSTMRRASQPDIPIIPNRFLSVSSSASGQSSSHPPGPLAMILHHPPLSADPAIRALSIDVDHSRGLGHDHLAINLCGLRSLEPSRRRLSSLVPDQPKLARRAPGHETSLSTVALET